MPVKTETAAVADYSQEEAGGTMAQYGEEESDQNAEGEEGEAEGEEGEEGENQIQIHPDLIAAAH